ncbi:MAG: Mur ligase domain-containing protein [Patescibacteria group bacterium]
MIERKHVHFIGICGTAMAPLAKALRDQGWRVTGSDKGIFPPMSDYLKQNAIDFYVGFHPERMGNPQLVVVGNYIGTSNPEYVAVRERGIPFHSYPEILSQFLIRHESIIVAGTYGKTLTTALLAWIWEMADRRPSYMVGGLVRNFQDGVRIADSQWSVVEGDEYPSSRWNLVPKFSYYRPKYVLLTGAAWDHADVYTTEESYLKVFNMLIRSIPPEGLIVAAMERPHTSTVLEEARASVLSYNRRGEGYADWSLEILARDKNGVTLTFHGARGETIGPCHCSVLGDLNLDHFAGAVGLARYCGIPTDAILRAVETFKGVRRRMEVRGNIQEVTVVDDFAHSPAKAATTLKGLRLHFPHSKIIAVFEPNVGNRVASTEPLYQNAFRDADVVMIPRLSIAKTGKDEEERMDGVKLATVIQAGRGSTSSSSKGVMYEPEDGTLVARITKIAQPGDVVVFMGSHGFRGMIEQTLTALSSSRA